MAATNDDPWAPFAHKYSINPESYEFVRRGRELGVVSYSKLGVEGARTLSESRAQAMGGTVDFQGDVTDLVVPSPYSTSGIPITVYKPTSCPQSPVIWIYFHGGGLVLGSRATHETALKVIAMDAGAVVVNVEYRRLPDPDTPYAPFDDGVVVTKWVKDNKEAVGGDRNSKIGIGGDSAGGHISASVTNEVTGLDFQVLVYPMTDTSRSNETFQEFKTVPGLNHEAIEFFFDNSLKLIPDRLTNPRVNPMVRTNTESSPPALIVLAELDPLRGCGVEYAEKLKAAGVKVKVEIVQGVPHAFFTLRDVFKTKCPEAYDHIVKFLKEFK